MHITWYYSIAERGECFPEMLPRIGLVSSRPKGPKRYGPTLRATFGTPEKRSRRWSVSFRTSLRRDADHLLSFPDHFHASGIGSIKVVSYPRDFSRFFGLVNGRAPPHGLKRHTPRAAERRCSGVPRRVPQPRVTAWHRPTGGMCPPRNP